MWESILDGNLEKLENSVVELLDLRPVDLNYIAANCVSQMDKLGSRQFDIDYIANFSSTIERKQNQIAKK